MKQLIYFSLLLLLSACLIVACNDDSKTVTEEPETGNGTMVLHFDNRVGSEDLNLDSTTYTNSTGEDFTVSKLNYFISNIKLTREDGSTYTIPQDSSYFRVLESDVASQSLTLKHLPEANYTAAEFIVGVDSLRSVSGIDKRGGALDPSDDMDGDGMYWSWSSGYIFLKLEGSSSKGNPVNGKYYYHIGFFGGYDSKTVNNLRTVKVNFTGSKASVTDLDIPEIRIVADVQKIFNGPFQLSIAQNPSVMFDFTLSAAVADNYKSMFSFGEVKSVTVAQ